jgi:hypothetical protein
MRRAARGNRQRGKFSIRFQQSQIIRRIHLHADLKIAWQASAKIVKPKLSVENNVDKYKPVLRSSGYWLIRKPRIFITRPFQARAIGRGLACFL